jgi:hypothetical protein
MEFELIPKRKVVPFQFIYYHAKFGNLWSSESTSCKLCKFESFEYLEICLDVGQGLAQCNSTGLSSRFGTGPWPSGRMPWCYTCAPGAPKPTASPRPLSPSGPRRCHRFHPRPRFRRHPRVIRYCHYPHAEPLDEAKVPFSSSSACPSSRRALCFPHRHRSSAHAAAVNCHRQAPASSPSPMLTSSASLAVDLSSHHRAAICARKRGKIMKNHHGRHLIDLVQHPTIFQLLHR